ncbi:hypothetical protein MSAN_01769700 [Mycena sanguinolenta]|uniref:Uncharacterized protein n=1 Tax=Mycena sanguinolenta TaxID=230812 RepID=A0A8H6XU44_9AGAR|nr:hypothetical protein MSAN_01769700 [Mycena sanguinolenta]
MDSAELNPRRVRVCTKNFVALAQLDHLPAIPEGKIEYVTIPQVILAVARRDTSLAETNLHRRSSGVEEDSEPPFLDAEISEDPRGSSEIDLHRRFSSVEEHSVSPSLDDEMSEDPHGSSGEAAENNGLKNKVQDDERMDIADSDEDEIMEILDSDEEALLDAHKGLSAQGCIIDLTDNI